MKIIVIVASFCMCISCGLQRNPINAIHAYDQSLDVRHQPFMATGHVYIDNIDTVYLPSSFKNHCYADNKRLISDIVISKVDSIYYRDIRQYHSMSSMGYLNLNSYIMNFITRNLDRSIKNIKYVYRGKEVTTYSQYKKLIRLNSRELQSVRFFISDDVLTVVI